MRGINRSRTKYNIAEGQDVNSTLFKALKTGFWCQGKSRENQMHDGRHRIRKYRDASSGEEVEGGGRLRALMGQRACFERRCLPSSASARATV